MANDTARARSNYFHVKDLDAFREALHAATENIDIQPQGDADPTYITLLSSDTDTGGWPSFEYDERTDEYEPIDLPAIIAPHLVDDEVVVLMEVGWQKLRYLFGRAVAFDSTGEIQAVDVDDIYELAKTRFGGKTASAVSD